MFIFIIDIYLDIKSKFESNNTINDLNLQNEFLQEQVKELNMKLENFVKERDRKESVIVNFTNNNFDAMKYKIEVLINENKSLSLLSDGYKQDISNLNKHFEKEIQKFNLERKSLLTLMNNYNQELNEFKAYFMKITNQKNLSEERNQNSINIINEYLNKLKAYENNLNNKSEILFKNEFEKNNLNSEILSINKKNELVNYEHNELKNNFLILQEKYFNLKIENDNYNKMYNNKLKEKLEKDSFNKENEKELIKIKNEKIILEGEIKHMSKENISLKRKIEELNRILNFNKKEILESNERVINQEMLQNEYKINHNKLREMFENVNFSKENLEKIKIYYSNILKERENKLFEVLKQNNLLNKEILDTQSALDKVVSENKNFIDKIYDWECKYKKLHMVLMNKYKN